MIIQIYEIQTPPEAEAMIALGVDHLGSVILDPAHWRDPALKDTIAAIQAAGRKSTLIPLFRDVETISKTIDYYYPDIIHFCEHLSVNGSISEDIADILARQRTIRRRFPQVGIMRSIPIGMQGRGDAIPSLQLAARFEPFSDWFLTDTVLFEGRDSGIQNQPVQGFVGITGRTCDWSVARGLVESGPIPVILAGGIGPSNVKAAIEQVQPAGVDSCTRTNATDGKGQPIRFKKDAGKVADLVKNARETAASIFTSI